MAIEQPIQILHKYSYRNPNLWEFSFTDNPGSRYLVKNISLPFINFETDNIGDGINYYTGYTQEEEFSIEFIETDRFLILEYLEKWVDTVYDKKKRVFRTGNHAKNGQLHYQNFIGNYGLANAFGKTQNTESIKTYDFRNILIVGIDNIENDYENTDAKKITARFIADEVSEFAGYYSSAPQIVPGLGAV